MVQQATEHHGDSVNPPAIKRPRVLRTFALLVSMLAVTAFTVVVAPEAAHARCNGEGVRVTSTLSVGGTVYVRERPDSGTCNDNGYYHATVESERPQSAGWCAFLAWRQEGTSTWHDSPAAVCDPGARLGYTVDSRSRPHSQWSFRLLLCTTNGNVNRCGWGSNYRTTDVGDPLNTTYTGVVSGY